MTISQVLHPWLRTLPALLACGIVTSCKTDGGGTGPGPTPAISMTLSVTSATVPQGGSAQLTATLTRSGGFTGTVTFSVSGVPAGVSGTVSNVVDAGGTSTGTITIQVASTVAPGTYNLTVRGSGTGVSDATGTFVLTVTASGFTITAQPTSASIPQGGSVTISISINRVGGFTGSVALVATGQPTGVTATMNPPSTTGNSATLTLAASATAPAGTYTIAINAAATGANPQSATVTLTVTTAGGGSGNVTVDLSCVQGVQWFAAQDGNGPWTPVTGTSGVYRFNITAATGGFTYVTSVNNVTQTIVQHYTRAELTASPFNYCPANGTLKSVNGMVSGLAATELANLSLGGGATATSANGAFTINNVAQGAHDFVGYRHDVLRDVTGMGNPDRGVIRRDQNIPAGGSLGTIDFAGGDSFAAASATITLNGVGAGEQFVHGMQYVTTAGCTSASLYSFGGTHAGTPFPVSGIPAASQRNTDLHQIFVTGLTGPQIAPTGVRTVLEFFRVLANRTINLPAALAAPTLTNLSPQPYRRMQAMFPIPGEYQRSALLNYSESNAQRSVSISGTLAFFGSNTATLAMPNFDGLSGWNNAWAPATGAGGTWVTAVGGDNITQGGTCVENTRVLSASQRGAY